MNIIDAFRNGDKVKRKFWAEKAYAFFKNGNFLVQTHGFGGTQGEILENNLIEKDFLADDWEVVKEKKIIETTLRDFPAMANIPRDAKVTITWEE